MTTTKKGDWQTKPFPELIKDLAFEREYSQPEMEQIKLGLIPKEMEDKWFIYYENDTLSFYRSWTGHQIYRVTFSQTDTKNRVTHATVNRDPSQYNQQDDAYDIKLLNFLIDRLLLNKNVPFPLHDSIEEDKQAIYRHSMIGHGRSNKDG
jgi:hypothetical protein